MRLRIAQNDLAVFEDRDIAEGVLIDQRALLMRAVEKIDRREVELQAKKRAKQTDLVAVT